jgi:Spy/CpxP family protein refolding chaperone
MKLTKTSIAVVAGAGLLALSTSLRAQTNASTNTPPSAGPRGGGGLVVESRLNRLTDQLKLTAEQKPKVRAVLEDESKQRQALRDLPPEERGAKMQTLREEMDKKMKEILTPEQFKKYGEIHGQGPRGHRNAAGGRRDGP